MAKKVAQVVYSTSSENVQLAQLQSGSVFEKYMPIVRLGIQIVDSNNANDTYFYLNGAEDKIYIGYTGIYELDLTNISQISKLQVFPGDTASKVLVDMVYESED